MRYMLLIYNEEGRDAQPGTPEFAEMMAAYGQFSSDMRAAGVFCAGEALQPVASATSVRLNDGRLLTTDGPFAETKEQLGGYYILDCKDLDEALHWAERVPTARYGTVEVRPIMEYGADGRPVGN